MKAKKTIKVRSYTPDFSTHTRKTPTFKEKQIKQENKYKKDYKNYQD